AEEIGKVRTLVAKLGKDHDAVKAAKLDLPAYLISGRIDGKVAKAMAEGRFHHSGLLQLDFDGIADPETFRDELIQDAHVIAAWLSPSGEGVKGLAAMAPATTEEEHKAAFLTAERHFAASGWTLDKACKNTNRLCFAGWDSELRMRDGEPQIFRPDSVPGESPPLREAATPPAPLVIRSKGFPEPPANGIHHWLPQAARWCQSNGMNEAEAVTKLKSYDGRLRRALTRGEVEDACRLVYSTTLEPQPGPKVQTLNGKPAIELPCPGRPLSDFAGHVGRLLAGAGVYSRSGLAFTVDLATKQLVAVDPQWLRTWAEGEVSLFKQAKTAAGLSLTLRHSMSLDVARALVVSPQFLAPLPEIKRFAPVRMPVMRADGRIELLPVGFDAETLTLTDPNGCEYHTGFAPGDGAKAIRGALAEFPFADERSRAAAVAAMLTIYAGGLLPTASTNPAFIYLANAEGSGKTTLAQLAGIPYGVCEAESKPASEEEWQKALLALVMGGGRLLLLDNLKGHLNSPSFEAYLTATKFSGRILGVNKKFSGDADAVVLLTGNRLTVSPDLRRRCIFVELFMQELRAEDRVFKRRLDAPAILELQPAILAALWCMVRGWDAAGRPPASKINSSVPRWSETIAGIVEWAGFACPSVPAELEDGGDTDTRDIAKLGAEMQPGIEMKFADLCALCESAGLFERFTDNVTADGPDGLKARREMSVTLKSFGGRMIAPGRRFTIEGKGHQRRYVIR
ncbi:MAG: BT4734/BF3469 family protein, partial [Verrucomicrobiota bacterium]